LKEAINEAMRDWVTNVAPLITSWHGLWRAPLSLMVAQTSSAFIGDERGGRFLEKEERLPDLLIACVGGGSNAMGPFYPFLEDAR